MKNRCFLFISFILSFQLFLPTSATPVIINEVLFDGPGSDADDVFTELYGTPGLVLDGWSLKGTNGENGLIYRSIDLSGATIPDNGYLLIATASANLALAMLTDFIANVDWQNGPDSIQLLDPYGDIIDALQYGDAGIYNRGEGLPALLPGIGHSLSRILPSLDTDNNLSDFIELTLPTPGTGPLANQVPEPNSMGIFLIGIAALLCMYPGAYLRQGSSLRHR